VRWSNAGKWNITVAILSAITFESHLRTFAFYGRAFSRSFAIVNHARAINFELTDQDLNRSWFAAFLAFGKYPFGLRSGSGRD
jgi:hypothetical protein